MSEVEIPRRALFKSSEVCEIASVQSYVLRSWESEFPDLGITKPSGGGRIYRRADVERVLRIKQLVFADGLTLAGARRRIEEEAPPLLEGADAAPIKELLGRNARERLAEVKKGLMGILELLSRSHARLPRMGPAARPVGAPVMKPGHLSRVAFPAKRKNGARSARPAAKTSRKRSRR